MVAIFDFLDALHEFVSTPQVSGPLGAWGMWLGALALAAWLFTVNIRQKDPVNKAIAWIILVGTVRFVLVSLGVWP